MPTPEEIEAIETAAAEIAAGGVQSATTGDQTTTAMDPNKQLDLVERLEARAARAASGGGWGGLKKERVVPGGPSE